MGEGFMLGVDLGTSHTVAMLRHPDGRTRPLLFDGRPLLPSAVFLDTTGRLHVGADALRLGQAEPGRVEPNPKRRIDEATVQLGETSVPVADLLAALLAAVAREAVATTGFLPPAALTYPAAWGAPRRQVLIEALGRADWPQATLLVPEPVAAARYFAEVLRRPIPAGSALAVFDFGGGTLDVAVVRNDGSANSGVARSEVARLAVVASGGHDDLGGLDLDAALVDHLGKSLAGAEPQAWHALTEPVTLAQWRARQQFWADVRGAKEMLSRSSFAPVPVPGVEHAVHLTRDELEAAADPLIRRGVAEAGAVIAAGGLAPADLAGLFLVGGSSRVPLVARLLHAELGIAPTVLEQPELPVAEGALIVLSAAASPGRPPTAPPGIPPGAEGASASAGAGGARFTQGIAAAATPTPTPVTEAEPPPPITEPPITDTRTEHTQPPTPAPAAGPPASPASRAGGPAGVGVPGQRVSEEDDRQYAEPVDPWATAEAAAVAAGGHPLFPGSSPPFPTHAGPTHPGPTYPGSPSDESGSPGWANGGSPAQPGPPGRPGSGAGPGGSGSDGKRRGRGRRAYAIGALTLTVVLAAGAALTWHFWPGYRALDYRSLTSPQRIKPAIPVDYTWSDAEVLGDRVYFASSDTDTGAVGVVAIDAGDKAPAWTSTAAGTPAGPTTRWRSMVALPVGVALFTETDTTTGKRDMAVLDAEHGTLRWHRALGDDDDVFFAGDVAVLVDRTEHRLLGVTLTDGKVRWEQLDPKTDSGTQTSVVLSTSPDDLAGPATVAGRPLAPDFGGDPRIVQISADQTARVLDARSGKVLGTRANVAGTNDEVIAHNGRLIVRESENAQRIVSYGLDRIGAGQPHVLYSAQAQNGQLSQVTPCGDDRVCLVEEAGDAKSAEVVAVDAAKGGRLWHRVLPDVTALIPVGEAVLADTTSDTTLLDANGGKVWTSPGVAARLNGGNLLEFNQPLSGSPGNPALAGQHLGDDPVQLGPLSDVRSETCSWNTSVLACVAEKDFVLQHFTK